MDSIEKVLAYNIVKLREDLGWSQDLLVLKTGLSKGTIQNYEGCKSWPEIENINILAGVFKVPPSRLFQDPDKIEEPTRTEAINKVCKELGFAPTKPLKKKKTIGTLLGGLQEVDSDHPTPEVSPELEKMIREASPKGSLGLGLLREKKTNSSYLDLSHIPEDIVQSFAQIPEDVRWDVIRRMVEKWAKKGKGEKEKKKESGP